jgi:glutaredoxin-related protein
MYLYNRSDASYLKENCEVFFKEVCSGVYEVIKDRFSNIDIDFADSRTVTSSLRNYKTVIQRQDGSVISNYNVVGRLEGVKI